MCNRANVGFVAWSIVALFVAAAPVAAQSSAPDVKGFIGAFGGMTFGTAEKGSALGARAGVEVARGVHIIGEVGRMSDVLPSAVKDELDLAASELEFELGVPVTIQLTAPATYGFVGLRWSRQTGRVSPFVEGGVGAARLTVDLKDVTVGGFDVTDLVRDEVTAEVPETTATMLALGAGVNAALTSAVSADFGYRYSRIFTDDPAVNSGTLYGMIVIGWR